MGKAEQQVNLVRKEQVSLRFGTTPLSSVASLPTSHKAGRALTRPQLPGLSSTLRAIIENSPGRDASPLFDQVTGLPDRIQVHNVLAEMIASGAGECTVVFVDLDNFRRINKCFGHETGDSLLQAAARRLHRFVSQQDGLVGRFGGDEFVMVVHGKRDEAALNVMAEQLVTELAFPLDFKGLSVSVTASVGIARFPKDAKDAGQLIQYAHTAMYVTKEMGGQGFRHFTKEMAADAADGLLIEGRLRQALENNEFSLMFQPIIRAGSTEIGIVETLLRWTNDQNEMIAPDRFIPVAEASGLILDIGRWVLHAACRQASHWQQTRTKPIVVSVNASPLQLASLSFCNDVQAALDATDLPPALLAIEMTEKLVVEEDAITSANIRRLTEMGVRVALDDFGTGYSSLSYLTRYQIQCIKIDRSFIAKIECDAQSRALVQAIIGIGKNLNVVMVAEGVETQGQATLLESMGCDYLQGFLIGRPVSSVAL
jgi:diguanylate cyclase (GGDEF)-like protein